MAQPKYLVAIDTSEETDEVIKAAKQLADSAQAEILLLTVIRPLAGVYGTISMAPYAQPSIAFEEEAMKQARRHLNNRAQELGLSPEAVHVKLGSPSIEIRALAEELRADLIVMGTHGRHGFGRLLGSTASAVLHGLPCDAHLVKIH